MNVKLPGAAAVPAGRDNRRTAIIAAIGVGLVVLVLVLKMFVLGGSSSSSSSPITGGPRATAASGAANGQRVASVAPAPGPAPNASRDIFRPLR